MSRPGFCTVIVISAAFSGAFVGNCAAAEPDARLLTMLQQASAAEDRADFASALALYKKASAEFPKSGEALAALGEHLRFYAHDTKAAAAAFEKALAVEPENTHAAAFAWRGLGELAAKEGRDEAAIESFKKSLAALPLADTHRSLCHLYSRQRKFKEAAEQARAAVKLSPDDPIARLLYAAQLHRSGEQATARREYDAALAEAGMKPDGKADAPIHCCVIYNAAGFLGVCGEKDATLKMLQRFFETPNHRHLSRADVENDADFDCLKDSAAFKALLDKYLPLPERQ